MPQGIFKSVTIDNIITYIILIIHIYVNSNNNTNNNEYTYLLYALLYIYIYHIMKYNITIMHHIINTNDIIYNSIVYII